MRTLTTRGPRWPQPDFCPEPARPSPLAWVWLLCAVVALALAADDWFAVAEARGEQQAQIERWRAAVRPTTARAGAGAVPAASAASAVAAQGLRRVLDHPWYAVFDVTERRAAPGLSWLRLEHEADRGELRLAGVARDREAVLATVDDLARATGWRDVLLMRLDTQEAAPGAEGNGQALRFELRAQVGPLPVVRAAR